MRGVFSESNPEDQGAIYGSVSSVRSLVYSNINVWLASGQQHQGGEVQEKQRRERARGGQRSCSSFKVFISIVSFSLVSLVRNSLDAEGR